MSRIDGGTGAQLSKGASPIWPTTKKEGVPQDGDGFFDVAKDSMAGVKPGDVAKPSTPPQVDDASKTAATEPAIAKPAVPETRQANMTDLTQVFVKQNIANTEINKAIALLMTQYGVELSSENFEQLQKLLKGRKQKSALESAVIAMSKGLEETDAATDFLFGLLSKTKKLTQQTKSFQLALQQFFSKASSSQMFEPGILGRMSSIVSEFDDNFKKMLKKLSTDPISIKQLQRGEMIKDVYSFQQLLKGLQQKYQGQLDQNAQKVLSDIVQKVNDFLGAITSPAILSKSSEKQPIGITENFAYWQIPNLLATPASTFDLLIRKEPMKKENKFDPQKTKIILKFDTDELGEVGIIVTILGKKIWYIFNSEYEATTRFVLSMQRDLIDRMTTLEYELAGFQSHRKKIDIKKLLLPTQNLNSVIRINTEV